jgi:hypothetical protein
VRVKSGNFFVMFSSSLNKLPCSFRIVAAETPIDLLMSGTDVQLLTKESIAASGNGYIEGVRRPAEQTRRHQPI